MNKPNLALPPQATGELACKCCGARAVYFGAVDFHKSPTQLLPLSGIPIPYHRCTNCGFLFTISFDHFTTDDFHRHIYNDDYVLVDPDYLDLRPRDTAAGVAYLFPLARSLSVLDYGGGNGRTAEYLRREGFQHVDVYDRFVPERSERPRRKYDLVISVEVAEHVTDPRGLFADLADLTEDAGLIFLTTLLQPANIDVMHLGWWYVLPRNGHVSFYTPAALGMLASGVGMKYASRDQGVHAFFRKTPPFATHLIK